MQLALAIAAALGTAAALIAIVAFVAGRIRLVKRLSFPLYVAAVAAGLKTFTLVYGRELPKYEKAMTGILIFVAVVAVVRLIGLYFFDVFLHTHRGVRLPPLLPKVAMGACYVLAALLLVPVAFPDANLTAFLGASAITSLVFGLALQPVLGNFFSGLVISLEKPFRINDWILFDGTEGRVVNITWRTTHIRTRDNDDLVVPNSKIADSKVLNYFYPHPLHMERIYVGVHYRTPPYRVKQAMMDVCDRVQGVLEKPSPAVYLHSYDDSAITYELRVWIEDIAHKPRIASYIRSEIWQEFRRRGITIPFPIRTLEIEPRARKLELVRPRSGEAEAAMPPARLYVARGPGHGRSIGLGETPATVGRSSGCELTLRTPQASKEHFRVEWREDRFFLVDLGSQHGTQVNDDPVDEQVLRDLDRITIGDTVIIFEEQDHG